MATGVETPWQLPVQLGSHQYAVDPKKFSRQDLPALRQQLDTGDQAGAQTLSVEGSFPRGATDWSFGGNQETFDAADSDPRKYGEHSNTQALRLGRIHLSPEMQQRSTTRSATSASHGQVAMCDEWMYWIDQGGAIFAADISAGPYSAITPASKLAAPASALNQITTDGTTTVWAITTSDGVYRATAAASGGSLTSWSSSSTFDGKAIGYVNGRLLIANGNIISEVSSTPTATVIHTFPTGVDVRGFIGTPGAIYLWTLSGREIYVMDDVDPTGALSPPRVAGVLSVGETVNTIVQASGVMLICTLVGLRLAVPSGDGSLTIGDAVQARDTPSSTPSANYYDAAFYGGFAYAIHTTLNGNGIARLDFQNFTGPLAPAIHPVEITNRDTPVNDYQFTHIVNAGGAHTGDFWVHGTNGSGTVLWGFTPAPLLSSITSAATTRAASGYAYSGWITLGISELKQPVVVNVIHEDLPAGATIKVTIVTDEIVLGSGVEVDLGTQSTEGSTFTTFTVDPSVIGPQRKFQVKLTLTRGTATYESPIIESWTVRAMPIPQRQEEILLSIMMYPEVGQGDDGPAIAQNLADEYDYLAGLRDARTPVDLTVLGRTSKVVVDRVAWPQGEIERINNARDEFVGTLYVRLLTVA